MSELTRADLARPVPRVRIRSEDGQLRAYAPDTSPQAFAPFMLPLFPQYLLESLAQLGLRHQRACGRSLAALLVLDMAAAPRWDYRFSRQRATRTSVTWSLARRDVAFWSPRLYAAGTYQFLCGIAPQAVREQVPPLDGVHLIQGCGEYVAPFLRVGESLQQPQPTELFYDEITAAADAALAQMHID